MKTKRLFFAVASLLMLGTSGAFASGGEALIPKIVPATLEASYSSL